MSALAVPIASKPDHRGSLFLEDAIITRIESHPGEQFVIRMTAPRCAATATPGSFVHIQCEASIPMRRPLSIMRANTEDGWIEVLFKIVGEGLRSLATRNTGDIVSIIGPIGRGFSPDDKKPYKLLIGGGVGIPPMIFLAERLHFSSVPSVPLVLMGSEIPFPFEMSDSVLATPWLTEDIVSTMPLLEDWNIAARLASQSDFKGCYRGFVTDLARAWLSSRDQDELQQCEVFSCGPTIMLEAVTKLCVEFDLPCQVSLEEFMACAVGGCAGCTVEVQTEDGPAMKRVCVDGPVFDGVSVFGAEGR